MRSCGKCLAARDLKFGSGLEQCTSPNIDRESSRLWIGDNTDSADFDEFKEFSVLIISLVLRKPLLLRGQVGAWLSLIIRAMPSDDVHLFFETCSCSVVRALILFVHCRKVNIGKSDGNMASIALYLRLLTTLF